PVLRQQLGGAVLGAGHAAEVGSASAWFRPRGRGPEEGGGEEAALRWLRSGGRRGSVRPAGERRRAAGAPGASPEEHLREAQEAGPAIRLARGRARRAGQGAPGERSEPGGVRDRRAEDLAAPLPGVSAQWPS